MLKLLLIEDDEACAYVTQGGLELIDNYEIVWAKNGQEGWKLYNEIAPDVVVSDIDMPLMDGYELVRKIRNVDQSVIIIMETGKTSPKDVVDSFNMGVDDYIKKPFVAAELHVRIQAILRKSRKKLYTASGSPAILSIGHYKFNTAERTLTLKENKLKLTPREASILTLLYENKNMTITRESILNQFWDSADKSTSRSLDVHISKLRKYLIQDTRIKIVALKETAEVMLSI